MPPATQSTRFRFYRRDEASSSRNCFQLRVEMYRISIARHTLLQGRFWKDTERRRNLCGPATERVYRLRICENGRALKGYLSANLSPAFQVRHKQDGVSLLPRINSPSRSLLWR